MDLDVDHYSIDELTTLLNLDTELDRHNIIQTCENEMEKYSTKPEIVDFYKNVQKKLLETLPSENVGRTFITEVKRGTINPDIKNTITRIINIDSSSRLVSDIINNSTDNFVCELSDTLLNVTSMSLLSIEIPMGWYTFSQAKGTATFIISMNYAVSTTSTSYKSIPITIPDGNYTLIPLLETIKNLVNTSTSTSYPTIINTALVDFGYTYDNVNGRVTFFTNSDTIFTLIWYDRHFLYPELVNSTLNNSVGKLLGFILPLVTSTLNAAGIYQVTASSLVDISGTKYIMLSIHDYLQNRINTNITGLNILPRIKNKNPSYYSPDMTQYKTGPTNNSVIPTTFMSQSKQTTINSINQFVINAKISACDNYKMFAKIPVKRVDWCKVNTGTDLDGNTTYTQGTPDMGPVKLMVDMSGPLQLNIREYFGPVNLSMFEFKLYDDKGNLLGLNGLDWSCSLLIKSVYQY